MNYYAYDAIAMCQGDRVTDTTVESGGHTTLESGGRTTSF